MLVPATACFELALLTKPWAIPTFLAEAFEGRAPSIHIRLARRPFFVVLFGAVGAHCGCGRARWTAYGRKREAGAAER